MIFSLNITNSLYITYKHSHRRFCVLHDVIVSQVYEQCSRGNSPKSKLVIATLNCEGIKDAIIRNIIVTLSNNHKNNIVLCLQETWRYNLSAQLSHEFSDRYNFLHESTTDSNKPCSRGRPFGGICYIISKTIAFTTCYTNC